MKRASSASTPGSPDILDCVEDALCAVARRIATVGVVGMLLAAGATVTDVFLRWSANVGLIALNEITAYIFAIAITATLPAGVAGKVNLKIDVFTRWMPAQTKAWVDTVGAVSLLLFFAPLTWWVGLYALSLHERGETMVILGVSKAPFYFVVAMLLGVTTAVQAAITVNDAKRAYFCRNGNQRPSLTTIAIAAALALPMIALFICVTTYFTEILRFLQDSPGRTVTIAFIVMWILVLGELPLATVTALVGIIGAALFIGFRPTFSAFATEYTGLLTNGQIATLPLFLMMGSFAAISGMADDLYRLAHVLFGRFRGGLALATIGSCAGFGALSGSSLATAATIGRVAIPEMEARGYSPALATGVCAAGGTLGPLVPPGSAPLIIFALLTEASVGKLFVASVGPAILAVLLYFITIAIYVRVAPSSAPVASTKVSASDVKSAMKQCTAVGILVFGVMGGLFFGIFTDTESASVGAIGAFACAVYRGRLNRGSFVEAITETTATTAMVYGLLIGAQIFSFFIDYSALPKDAAAYIGGLNWNPAALMAVILGGYLLLGTIMESIAVMIITVPIITPIIVDMGFDIVWWGIIMMCVVETGLIHPPFGLNVFVLKGITPNASLWTIYKGVTPFVVADLVKLAALLFFPFITLWLPSEMMR